MDFHHHRGRCSFWASPLATAALAGYRCAYADRFAIPGEHKGNKWVAGRP
jgi:hypothetical protein